MILEAARAASSHLFSAPFRGVFLKSLGLTLLALAAAWFALKADIRMARLTVA